MRKIPRILPLVAIAIGGVVLVRAIGVAPGLFEGARAWAEEAVQPAAEPLAPAPPVCALTPAQLAEQAGITEGELNIIQALSKRRGELDARDADFATALPLMVAAEQKLDAKLQALNAVKAEVQALLGQVDEKEKAEIDRLVAVYSAMRPREAAAVFSSLEDRVRLPVAAAMRPRSLAAVMAQMPPAAARDLTEKLARRFEAQQLAARAAAANVAEPAAKPAGTLPAPTQAAANPDATPAAQPARATPARTPQRRPQRASAAPQARQPTAPATAPVQPPASGNANADTPRTQPRQSVQ